MIPFADFFLCEEFIPAFPWDEFERKWLIENIKKAEKELDCCRNAVYNASKKVHYEEKDK